MAKGFILHRLDPTSCGGRVLEGSSNRRTNGNPVARMGDSVSCGKDGNTYRIVGGIPWIETDGRLVAGSLDSFSGCPCKAKIIPQITVQTYESRSELGPQALLTQHALSLDPVQYAQSVKRASLPSYLTGEKEVSISSFVSDYPVLLNTRDLPDEVLVNMLRAKRQRVTIFRSISMVSILPSSYHYLFSMSEDL